MKSKLHTLKGQRVQIATTGQTNHIGMVAGRITVVTDEWVTIAEGVGDDAKVTHVALAHITRVVELKG